MRLILASLLLSLTLTAAPVFVTDHGKTYHTNRKCMALSRATKVLTAEDADAKGHGLKPCGICNRAKSPKTTTGNGSWAKESK